MHWKGALNRGLTRATGLELRRADGGAAVRRRRRTQGRQPGDRLVRAPAFVICSVRSGSTLLRVLLDSHSRIHSPQELHLRDLTVRVKTDYAAKALGEIGLDDERMRFLLWDRLLHRELVAARKDILVNKTPNDVFIVDLIARCWPDARFIYLFRHPGAIARSRQATRPAGLAGPQRAHGAALRQRDRGGAGRIPRSPTCATRSSRRIRARRRSASAAFLGVSWEPAMLEYGRFDHGRMKPGLGDWKEKIKSGEIQPADPPPPLEEIHPSLRELCEAWGYAPAPAVQPAS